MPTICMHAATNVNIWVTVEALILAYVEAAFNILWGPMTWLSSSVRPFAQRDGVDRGVNR